MPSLLLRLEGPIRYASQILACLKGFSLLLWFFSPLQTERNPLMHFFVTGGCGGPGEQIYGHSNGIFVYNMGLTQYTRHSFSCHHMGAQNY